MSHTISAEVYWNHSGSWFVCSSRQCRVEMNSAWRPWCLSFDSEVCHTYWTADFSCFLPQTKWRWWRVIRSFQILISRSPTDELIIPSWAIINRIDVAETTDNYGYVKLMCAVVSPRFCTHSHLSQSLSSISHIIIDEGHWYHMGSCSVYALNHFWVELHSER